MLATRVNMKLLRDRGAQYDGPSRTLALNPSTNEEFSADPSDYWYLSDSDCLTDKKGRKLILVVYKGSLYEYING